MATRMQQRRGTASQWTAANPVLAAGEIGFETDSGMFKMGDGTNQWSALSYFKDFGDLDTSGFILDSQMAVAGGVATLNSQGQVPISQLGSLITNAPAALDTLGELASAVDMIGSVVDGVVNTHNGDTTNVHGITDTTVLATNATVATAISTAITEFSNDSTNIHGIADTTLLATKAFVESEIDASETSMTTARNTYVATEIETAITTHTADTTNVHGIADTALLSTKAYADAAADAAETAATVTAASYTDTAIGTHGTDTTNVHGIADTALLATTANVATAKSEAIAAADTAATTALGTHSSDTTSVHGIADTSVLETSSGAQAKADAAVLAHGSDTTDVHGIADTSALATKTYADSAVGSHNTDTTDVHGIADTSLLATTANVATAKSEAIASAATAAGTALTAHNDDTTNVHGIADVAALATATSVATAIGLIKSSDLNWEHYDAEADLPSATTKHGMFAHVHGTGSAYFAHAGSWKKILDTTSASSIYAPTGSPALTGVPTAPTAAAGTNTTQVATTAFVGTAVSNLVASSPAALDTLNELATALGNDAAFSTTVTNALALKATKAELESATLSSFNTQTTSYTLALSDATNMVETNSSSTTSITVPPNSSVAFPIGTSVDVFQKGTGQTSIVAGSGVTIYRTPGLKLRAQYSGGTLTKRDTDTWILSGDLTA